MSEQTTSETAVESTIDELTDPGTLTDREDVEHREETRTVGPGGLDPWEPIDGVVVVGVTGGDGDVLLVDLDDRHGWALPHGPVRPGQDYVDAGEQFVKHHAGLDVEVTHPERVRHVEYQRVDDAGRTTVDFLVVAARPATDTEGNDAAVLDSPDVGWFDAIPDDVTDGDQSEDVRLFLD